MKLARTIEMAHTLFPRDKPVRWNHKDSNIKADTPERKKIK
jgi:hypothetical protein